MWCQHCQQDVPATGSPTAGAMRCCRCLHEAPPPAAGTVDHSVAKRHDSVADLLEGTSAQRMRELGRRLGTRPLRAQSDLLSMLRIDPPQMPTSPTNTDNSPSHPRSNRDQRFAQLAAWIATFAGTCLLVAGGAIVARALVTSHANWWSWGLGCVFVGQSLVVVGLVRVLMSLWSNSLQSSRQLTNVEQRLRELKQTAAALSGERHPTAAGFYANLSREANPHLLLGSLRGQIDELMSRLHADL